MCRRGFDRREGPKFGILRLCRGLSGMRTEVKC